ncbi:hypothetical protein [Lentilactobacillus hilgardii]|uniref:Phage protein Gp138 N-terminal domain-containing protein n=1 Tax=Lentilactobacillus hilgardii (strain ATCC 8290 / DSM 20176 / CCUG 30140 / JCM 1155 / KCTC 3500 / NBRC 15886 / NCIMB 8040 / NRRL B-1843 / 9) TaxID=1423757 RepID=C0XG26_LENH9|nr:hypothetical protein [Lentilactobacillus hilgardii]EEI25663.1 hypothetical protein HMPREF0519_0187 [Lentilactobacillus hilgardii DSM 20176 = ATCC 8290]KRK53530.1 hypothetical protein FD42_GL002086 [Lentilactobacillus hilgardii DSM 20176 = ATCC 8290]QEU38911.1 hypothetical protein LH500_08425 [Lentilactobacillus hilgardii]TDG86528.1 hypothetical protein C5L34_002359 [Lentilactobacillus hilgardii]
MTKSRNYIDDFFNTYKNDVLSDIHGAIRCKIVKVNADKTYDVQPLALFSDGTKRPQLLSLQASFIPIKIKYHDDIGDSHSFSPFFAEMIINYQVGDVVVVVFEDRDTSNAKGDSVYKIDSERMHDANDGVIVGKIDIK